MSLDKISEDSLESSKLPLTHGIQSKRQAKRSTKKEELIKKIMKEHNIDMNSRAKANRLNYELPPLYMDKLVKSNTPVTQILRQKITDSELDC